MKKEKKKLMKLESYYRYKEKLLNVGKKWDRLALGEYSAISFAEKHINREPVQYEEDGISFTMEYCLVASGPTINDRYRGDCVEDMDKRITDAVADYRTDADLIVYRGVVDHVFELMKKNAKGRKGVDLYEKGFLHTSLVKDHELLYDIRLRIFIPAGSKCVYVGNLIDEHKFYEVIVYRGSALKVVSMDDKYINCILLTTE